MVAPVERGMSYVSAGPLGLGRPKVLLEGLVCVRPPEAGGLAGLRVAVPGPGPGESHRLGKEVVRS